MSILTEIIARKRERVDLAKKHTPLEIVRDAAMRLRDQAEPHRFIRSLRLNALNIISEFKRRSPSKGVIRSDVDLTWMVKCYEAGGAAALSILTEEDYFDGSLDDLRRARELVELPVLRKDFLFDEYQVLEAAAAGADAILLIVAALDDELLLRLRRIAENDLGLDALVEVHDAAEMSRAVAAGAKLIGVNNRNLHTFEVTLQTSVNLSREAPSDAVLVSESGLRTTDDLLMLKEVGYSGFLIGETLMRAEKPDDLLRALTGSQLINN